MNDDWWISPTMKSRLRIVESTEATGGASLKIEFENLPGDIGPPCHCHPHQEERFTVIEGRLALRVGNQEHELGAGGSIVVPRDSPHTFYNPGAEPVRFTSEHHPALGFERFITSLYDLDYDGLSDEKGMPKLLQLMVMLESRRGEEFLVGPPRLAQRMAAATLGRLGRRLGYRASYVSKRRKAEHGAGDAI